MPMNKTPTRPPERDRVYDVIDGERGYQEDNAPQSEKNFSPGETLALLDQHLRHAQTQWSNEPEGRTATINNLRTMAGVLVRALEILGPIPREFHVPASAGITGTLDMRDKGDRLPGTPT